MRRLATLTSLLSVLLVPEGTRAQDGQLPSQYQIEAAFIFNFAKFIEWPADAFAKPSSPLIIGVLGENPFGSALEQAVRNKTIGEHPLEVKEFVRAKDATNCHILFISSSEKRRLPEVLSGLGTASILTVSETEGFTEAGGMINFVADGNKLRFQINEGAAKKSNLKISSKLLNLAKPR